MKRILHRGVVPNGFGAGRSLSRQSVTQPTKGGPSGVISFLRARARPGTTTRAAIRDLPINPRNGSAPHAVPPIHKALPPSSKNCIRTSMTSVLPLGGIFSEWQNISGAVRHTSKLTLHLIYQ